MVFSFLVRSAFSPMKNKLILSKIEPTIHWVGYSSPWRVLWVKIKEKKFCYCENTWIAIVFWTSSVMCVWWELSCWKRTVRIIRVCVNVKQWSSNGPSGKTVIVLLLCGGRVQFLTIRCTSSQLCHQLALFRSFGKLYKIARLVFRIRLGLS